MSTVVVLVALVVVGVITLVALDALITKPTLAAGLVIAMAIFITAFGEVGRIPAGGTPISVPDGVFILVTLAGVARLLRIRRSTGAHLLLVVIGILVIVSLLQGVPEYGAQAGRELRPFLRFFGPALYLSTVTPDPQLLERLGRVWVRGIIVLLGLVFLRLAAVATGIDLGLIASRHPSASFALRVIPGYESFTIGQAFVLLMPTAVLRPDNRALRALTIVLGVIMIVLNRRTVYVAALVGLVVLISRSKALRRGAPPLLFAVVVSIAAATALFASYLPDTSADEDPVAQSPVDPGTLMGRIEGWEYLVAEQQRGIEWMIGTPLGRGFDRIQNGNEVGWNPHSYYVLLLLRTGMVGLVAFIMLYLLSIYHLRKTPSGDELLSPSTLIVLLVMQLVFFTTWIAPIEQGLLLGLGCAFCRTTSRERGGVGHPEPMQSTEERPLAGVADASHDNLRL